LNWIATLHTDFAVPEKCLSVVEKVGLFLAEWAVHNELIAMLLGYDPCVKFEQMHGTIPFIGCVLGFGLSFEATNLCLAP
jgi:hypothetical protein